MIKRILDWPPALFVFVFVWKLFLLILAAQPVPSNDAFFYDGPVVNFLLHGKYENPSLALALPISGNEVFSAYPPLYQVVLLGWMSIFGVSAISAMAFHLVLFGIYSLLLLATLHYLKVPVSALRIAALFLFVITFHDRPDSLAHVFGTAAVYSWIRSWRTFNGTAATAASPLPSTPIDERENSERSAVWSWLMVGFVILCLATSAQIGAVYFLLVCIGMLGRRFTTKEKVPVLPLIVMAFVPLALLMIVVFALPHLWAGFLEHATQTPTLTGWRRPQPAEVLKLLRTAPGILAVAALSPWWIHRGQIVVQRGFWLVTLTCTLTAMTVLAVSMFLLSANFVFMVAYLQPLIVGAFLAFVPSLFEAPPANRPHKLLVAARFVFIGLAVFGSIRAIGMSTWGLACAADIGYPASLQRIRAELNSCPPNSSVVVSSAFLYEAARKSNIRQIHSDWLTPVKRGEPGKDLEAVISLKPARMIITQFDYYRRFEPLLQQLRSRPETVELNIINTAQTPAPDSFRSLQKVVQHISWAPVIVSFSWN